MEGMCVFVCVLVFKAKQTKRIKKKAKRRARSLKSTRVERRLQSFIERKNALLQYSY